MYVHIYMYYDSPSTVTSYWCIHSSTIPIVCCSTLAIVVQ